MCIRDRALSFALASVMLVGMMVVGAGAVDFGDADEIVNTEAVQTMVALGVINGKDTGNFDPEGIVTRAEMAKIICVMLNGGKDVTGVTKADPSYTDIKGHWAEGYIEYCSALGIIAGRGDGTFQPDGTVTGTEAAKMLLVALGYDSDVFEFTGANWAIKVNSKANEIKLYDGIEHITVDAGLTRDNTAQMAYNTLDAYMMERTYDKVQSNGEITYNYVLSDTTTFLNDKFDAYIFIGTMMGNTDTLSLASEGQIQVKGCLDTEDKDKVSATANFPSDLSIANIGEEVKVIFKDGKSGTNNRPDKNDTIYGVFNTGKTEVVNATLNDIKTGSDAPSADDKIKVGSVEYKVAEPKVGDVLVEYDYDSSTDVKATAATTAHAKSVFEGLKKSQNGSTVKFVTNDDGNITSAYVVNYEISYVTAVNSEKITLSGVGAIKIADNEVYEDIAKNDIVVYTRFYDSKDKDEAFFTVTKAETISGELTSYKNSTDNIGLDGTTYKVKDKKLSTVTIGDDTTTGSFVSDDIGEEFTAYLVAGYVGYVIQDSDSANKYALVTEVSTTGKLGSTFDDPKVQLLLADGTKVTVVLDEDSILYKDSTKFDNKGAQLKDDGTELVKSALEAGQLVRYTETSSGTYKVVEVVTGSTGTYDNQYSTASAANDLLYDKDTKSFQNVVTAGDAVIFVQQTDVSDGSIEWKAYNIRNLNDIKAVASGDNVGYMTKDGKVVAAYVELNGRPSGASNSMFYGIVSSYNGTVKEDGDVYKKYTVEAGDESYTVLLDENSKKISGTGVLVGFEPSSDSIYNDGDIKVYDGTAYDNVHGLATWVKEYNEADQTLTYWENITYTTRDGYQGANPKTVALDDDCVIAYVNSDDEEGGDETGISAFDGVTGYRNVLLVRDDSNSKVVGIFVETTGDAEVLNSMTPATPSLASGATAAEIKQQPDGVYVPTTKDFAADASDVTGDAEDNRIFKFTADATSQEYTLIIKNAKGDTVYTEGGATFGDSAGHFFYICVNGASSSAPNAGTGTYKEASFAAGTYTYTISGATAGVVASGSFQI